MNSPLVTLCWLTARCDFTLETRCRTKASPTEVALWAAKGKQGLWPHIGTAEGSERGHVLRWNKTPSQVLSLRTARGLAQPCLSRDTGTPHLVAARLSSYFWKALRISEMTLGSSRVVVSPRSCPLLVMIFLSSLLITFPDLVLGRRFTTWQR